MRHHRHHAPVFGSWIGKDFAPGDEQQLHSLLVKHQGAKMTFRPMGRSDAIKILGANSLAEALQGTNPWASLKGLASRPCTRFRWVLGSELKLHIAQQANKKHGAHVPGAKQKKQHQSIKQVTQIDPSTLPLLPDTFVDADGDDIPQIPFAEVGQDATGLTFCTFQEAKPLIEAAETISSTTLGLLINTEIPMDFWGDAAINHLCLPALCTETDEPLLLNGSLLTVSDGINWIFSGTPWISRSWPLMIAQGSFT